MNNKTYEHIDTIYNVYSRIYHIVIEQFEISEIPLPVLDFVFHHCELSSLELFWQIEQEFDIEIPNEVSEKMVRFRDILEFVLEQIYNLEILEIAEYLKIRIKAKTLKLLLFLESKKIEISKFIEIFSSDTFSNNSQNIEKLILSLKHKSLDVSSIISFSDIFKNDFLLSNLEQICQIYCFMNDQKISYFDVIEIIKSGYLDSCKQEIDDLSEKIKLQESEIKNLRLQLEKANQNLDLLRGQLNHLLDDI